jgi:hypothetical protein
MAYAEKTKVPVSQSKSDIEKLVNKYSAPARADFGIIQRGGAVQIVFVLMERHIMFRMMLPDDPQQERSMWRALLLTIKGKLESSERGIETFEEAFLANIVMPDGRTVADTVKPAIESSYAGNDVPLLPSY